MTTLLTPANPTERACVDWLIRREGGHVNDPLDHGGITAYGLTAPTLGRWAALHRDATPAEVAAVTEPYARHLYLDCLIRSPELRLDLLTPPAAAVAVCDTAVLFGPSRAIRWAQAAAGAQVDGILGPASRAAIAATPVGRFVAGMQDARTEHHVRRVREEPGQVRFLLGWLRRSNALTSLIEVTV